MFSPLNFWSVFGFWQPSRWRRLHRKLCVVDGRVAFCGGINILDDYADLHASERLNAPRLDYAVRIEGGALVEAVLTRPQPGDVEFVLSPRSASRAAALAARFPEASVANHNVPVPSPPSLRLSCRLAGRFGAGVGTTP